MSKFKDALFHGHSSRDTGPESNKALNEQKKLEYYRQHQTLGQSSPIRQQTFGPNGIPQRNTGMSAEHGGRSLTYSYQPAPVYERPPHAFDSAHDAETRHLDEEGRRREPDMRPQPPASDRRPVGNSRKSSVPAGIEVSTYHRQASQGRPPIVPTKERGVSDVGSHHEARWENNDIGYVAPLEIRSSTREESFMRGALNNAQPSVIHESPPVDGQGVDRLYVPLDSGQDPRPAKDAAPSRSSAWSPRNLVPTKMIDKYKQHRRERSEAKEESPVTPSFKVLGQSLDAVSTQGIVNGDLEPRPRDVRTSGDRSGNSGTSELDGMWSSTGMSLNPATASSTYVGAHHDTQGHLPIAQSMQSQASQAPQPYQQNIRRPSTFDNATHYEEGEETDAEDRSQDQMPRDGEGVNQARAAHDLYMVHAKLRDAAPKNAHLAKSSTADQAAHLVVELFHRADHGWKSQFERAENLQRIVGDYEKLQQEVGHLQRQNQDMYSRSELFGVKEELFTRTKKDCERLENELATLRKERQDELEAQRRSYENKLEELKQDNSDLRRGRIELERAVEMSRGQAAHNSQEVDRLNDVVKTTLTRVESEKRQNGQDRERLTTEHRESLANMENMHVQDTRDLREQVARLEAEHTSRNLEHQSHIESLHRDHDQAIRDLQADHRIDLDKKDDEIRDAERHLDEHYEGELRKKDQQIQRLKTTHEDQVVDQSRRHNEQLRELREDNSRLRADLHEIEARVRNEYEVRERKSNAAHQEQLREAKQRSENLMGALVQRDGFKGIADRVVEARFKKLAKSVDQLSRTCTNWERSKEADWPCTERSLQGQENVRQVKQYFVQNAIWTVLYDHVFDTPFKSFGFDGDSYFREWTNQFGEETSSLVSPHWPQPGTKCEKWRYDTMQKCIDGVEKPSGDPTLKRAYADGMQRVCDELTRDLDRMVSNTSGLQRNLKDIVNQATKLWLDLGVQRCRILIAVPLASRGTSSRRDSQRLRDLVIQPEVQRIGNAQGENLETQEVVVCKMDVHRLVIR